MRKITGYRKVNSFFGLKLNIAAFTGLVHLGTLYTNWNALYSFHSHLMCSMITPIHFHWWLQYNITQTVIVACSHDILHYYLFALSEVSFQLLQPTLLLFFKLLSTVLMFDLYCKSSDVFFFSFDPQNRSLSSPLTQSRFFRVVRLGSSVSSHSRYNNNLSLSFNPFVWQHGTLCVVAWNAVYMFIFSFAFDGMKLCWVPVV